MTDISLLSVHRVETSAISCKARTSNCVLAGCHSRETASYTVRGIDPVTSFPSFPSFPFHPVSFLPLFVHVDEFPGGNRDWSGSLFDSVFDRGLEGFAIIVQEYGVVRVGSFEIDDARDATSNSRIKEKCCFSWKIFKLGFKRVCYVHVNFENHLNLNK